MWKRAPAPAPSQAPFLTRRLPGPAGFLFLTDSDRLHEVMGLAGLVRAYEGQPLAARAAAEELGEWDGGWKRPRSAEELAAEEAKAAAQPGAWLDALDPELRVALVEQRLLGKRSDLLPDEEEPRAPSGFGSDGG